MQPCDLIRHRQNRSTNLVDKLLMLLYTLLCRYSCINKQVSILASGSTNEKNGDGAVPAYRKIEDDIRLKVKDGRLPVGAMLASRHNLAKEYGVALSTAQQAIANLIADGILESFDRRGTFVARPKRLEAAVASPSSYSQSSGSAVVAVSA